MLSSIMAFAASRPNNPPPITAPVFAFFTYAFIASRSSKVRYTNTPVFSTPGNGGTNAEDPVATTKIS